MSDFLAMPPVSDSRPGADRLEMEREVARLAGDSLLVESAPFGVYVAEAARIPRVLLELGRLRALAFPYAFPDGAIDLDPYDRTYAHLFVWNHATSEVVGGYRLARTDELGALARPAALYTSELFDYDARLLARLEPALELGRSFVRPSYQRSYSALNLLWKGIGACVARAPRYRYLFGALTVPHELPRAARNACLGFLDSLSAPAEWQSLVTGRVPVDDWERDGGAPAPAEGLAALEHAVRAAGGPGVPPLLKHYVRLGAWTLGFSQDPAFGGSVDALIVVDLAALPAAARARYLGPVPQVA